MRKDDIVVLPVVRYCHGFCVTPASNPSPALEYHRARVLTVKPVHGVEFIGLEFIEGPLDGGHARYSRGELDRILDRTGGEEWRNQE